MRSRMKRNVSETVYETLWQWSVLLLVLSAVSFAAHPNKKIIFTDVMDDDLRAITNYLTDPQTRDSIEAFVVSTGNTHLKAAVIRQMVAGYGLNIPVYAGTATNLASHPVSSFAGNFEKEGLPILSEIDVENLALFRGRDGNAVQAVTERLRNIPIGQKLDIVLLTAPIDLVKIVQADRAHSFRVLEDGFGMGFAKSLGDGKMSAPFNSIVGAESVVEFQKLIQEGLFTGAFHHVRTDVVQKNSGLPGGYVPDGVAGQALRARLTAAMTKNPVSHRLLQNALEYAYNWRSSAAQEFGIGVGTDLDRWVPGSFSNPQNAVGFYLADTVPVELSKMTAAELAKQKFADGRTSFRLSGSSAQPLIIEPSGNMNERPVRELTEFDGMAALEKHVSLLEAADQFSPTAEFRLNPIVSPRAQRSQAPETHDGRKRSLLIVFKNSPDDWFALARVLSTEHGREALAKGGIIVEGFKTVEVANAVRSLVASLGETEIPVVAGHQYTDAEVRHIPNFKGELALYDQGEGLRAFSKLAPVHDRFGLDATRLIERAMNFAGHNGDKVDFMILGEGIDLARALPEGSPHWSRVGDLYDMGDGRLTDNRTKLALTRNWLPHGDEVIPFLERAAEKGKNVLIFSSNEFGGSLVSKTSGEVGNGNAAFTKLDRASELNPAFAAMKNHWLNWSRIFAWITQKEPTAWDPNKAVDLVTISPLGLTIADEWSKGELPRQVEAQHVETPGAPVGVNRVSLLGLLKPESQTSAGGKVAWLARGTGQEIVPLARRFSDAIDNLLRSREANRHHHAARDFSIFSPEAQQSLDEVRNTQLPGGTCAKKIADLGGAPPAAP